MNVLAFTVSDLNPLTWTTATWIALVALLLTAAMIFSIAPLRDGLGRVLRERSFVGVAVILGVAALSLAIVIQSLTLRFRKEALPLAVSRLDDPKEGIPSRVGPWVQVSKDEPLDHNTIEVLGTKEFVFRDYVDSRLFTAAQIDAFTDKPTMERLQLLDGLQREHPEGVVRLAITYYTGLVDTVPHVPEKCYVADGFQTEGSVPIAATVGAYADGTPRAVDYSYLHFQDTTGMGRVDRDVAYLFHVNGRYVSNNIAVREELADLRKKYGYFAKVELMTTGRFGQNVSQAERDASQAKSKAAFNDLLTAVLPEVERCVPDWKKVTASK
jgi:hypothetical protein